MVRLTTNMVSVTGRKPAKIGPELPALNGRELPALTLLEKSGSCVDQIKAVIKEFFRCSIAKPLAGECMDLIGKHKDLLIREVVDRYALWNVSA